MSNGILERLQAAAKKRGRKVVSWDACHMCGQKRFILKEESSREWRMCWSCGTVWQPHSLSRGDPNYTKPERHEDPKFVNYVGEVVKRFGGDDPKAHIIDVGCGIGWLARVLKRDYRYHHVWAMELPGFDMDACVADGVMACNCDMSLTNPEPQLENLFSYIVCNEVMEHVLDPTRFMASILKIARHNAKVFVKYCPDWWREEVGNPRSASEWRYPSLAGVLGIIKDDWDVLFVDKRRLVIQPKGKGGH